MKTIQTKAVISEDRRLIVQLPEDVETGEHDVVLTIQRTDSCEATETTEETPVRWDGNLLVYDGEITGPVDETIQQVREERMRQLTTNH